MNGFEPLRRRIIDYTAAGQWQEVYDGPVEECEEYKLKAENTKLRDLVKSAWGCIHVGVSCSNCRLVAGGCTLQSAMHELGVK